MRQVGRELAAKWGGIRPGEVAQNRISGLPWALSNEEALEEIRTGFVGEASAKEGWHFRLSHVGTDHLRLTPKVTFSLEIERL
jgi:hypothetical protein